jgi:hypothetical protein
LFWRIQIKCIAKRYVEIPGKTNPLVINIPFDRGKSTFDQTIENINGIEGNKRDSTILLDFMVIPLEEKYYDVLLVEDS